MFVGPTAALTDAYKARGDCAGGGNDWDAELAKVARVKALHIRNYYDGQLDTSRLNIT